MAVGKYRRPAGVPVRDRVESAPTPGGHPATGPRGSAYRGGMGLFGELFPGRKLRQDGEDEDAGSGQPLERGPLDLDSGVVFLRPRATEARPAPDDDPEA